MRTLITAFLLVVVLSGCSRGTTPQDVVVEPGLGVPDLVELGMTPDEVRGLVRGELVQYYPEIRYPWQVADYDFDTPHLFQARSHHTRAFYEAPSDISVQVPDLGLEFAAKGDTNPIPVIFFYTDEEHYPADDYPVFTGRISCGLSFEGGRNVTRDEVVLYFGEADVKFDDSGIQTTADQQALLTKIVSEMAKGRSVSKWHSNGVEHLSYPLDGIMFVLQNDKVLSFTIGEKHEAMSEDESRDGEPSE